MPGLFFNQIFKLSDDTTINFVFIDTNMYEKSGDYCQGIYPPGAKEEQSEWMKKVLQSKSSWNIVIGHIPILCNSHKEKASSRVEKELFKTVEPLSEFIDLYMCADEQYITFQGLPPQAGGAILDQVRVVDLISPTITGLARTTYGFS